MEGSVRMRLCSAVENDFRARNMNDDDIIKENTLENMKKCLITIIW